MIILSNPLLFRILSNPPRGMALFPFILIRSADDIHDRILIHHEKIHLRQQLELFIVPFYVFYLGHYFINLIKYRNHDQAYFNICFEREAYQHENQLDYLKTRKFGSFMKYF